MERRTLSLALVLALPLGLAVSACGGPDDRLALTDDELERELDLALPVDTGSPTFEDTVVEVEREEPTPPAPAPVRTRPAPPPQQPPRTALPPEPRQPQPETVTASIPAGTTLAIRMRDELSTAVSQPGDVFTATVTAPLLDGAGGVLVPAGATVRGRVMAAAPSTRVGQKATMTLVFEAITFEGRSYPLDASVERAAVEQRTRSSVGEQAGKVAAGAAAGAVLGQVIGRDRQSTVRGAVIGAAAGTAVAMGTADVDAVLPSGAEVIIRLDRPVQVTRTAVR